jgi:peptidoglycan/LPS O-acetylase OafA/YrhL
MLASAAELVGTLRSDRVEIIDVIRFLAALWVMLGHLGPFPLIDVDRQNLVGALAHGIYNNLFSGPAAVIVFFVISGYCIHRPFRDARNLPLLNYFVRRYTRILVPMYVAVLFARPVGIGLPLFSDSILWSLFAELVYYTLYPLFRPAAKIITWRGLVVIGYLSSLAIIATNPAAKNYASYGLRWNWLLALPCWLLGCVLAEARPQAMGIVTGRVEIWAWRFGIWAFSVTCSALRFHSAIGYPWTLGPFALAVYLWLAKEIAYNQHNPPTKALAWAGLWTYSLYLTHKVTYAGYQTVPGLNLSGRTNWCIAAVSMLLTAYIFYLFVEKPSHLLARRLARTLQPRSSRESLK